MSVLNKEQLMDKLKSIIGDETSDETLTFIEDVSDTYDSLDKSEENGEDWKKKYEDNDKEWREKYKARFFEGEQKNIEKKEEEKNDENDDNSEPKKLTFENLFKEE